MWTPAAIELDPVADYAAPQLATLVEMKVHGGTGGSGGVRGYGGRLKTLLDERINDGLTGKVSTKNVSEILYEDWLKAAAINGLHTDG